MTEDGRDLLRYSRLHQEWDSVSWLQHDVYCLRPGALGTA
jgi:hypothetical protein